VETPYSTILVVDDEPFNLEILIEYLDIEGYRTVSALNGVVAWEILEKAPESFDAILLDRMMPEMDGMEVLTRIKAHPVLNSLPVIMQTAKAAKEDVVEGLQAGAYYYLTKPFDKDKLLAIVKTAVQDHQEYRHLQRELAQATGALFMMDSASFHFKTIEQGRNLAALLANAVPNPDMVVLGLSELVVNAVEHGNLGISYEQKSALVEIDDWADEVRRRMDLPEHREKRVTLNFTRTEREVRFLIEDQGAGFDWEKFLEISPERAFHTHGRGIAIANTVSFSRLEYRGRGNQVLAVVDLEPGRSEGSQ
jgi:DNA-binding response OmpR family regulator